MKPKRVRIRELQTEIAKLTEMYEEAKSKFEHYQGEAIHYHNLAQDMGRRMFELLEDISRCHAEINELEAEYHATA